MRPIWTIAEDIRKEMAAQQKPGKDYREKYYAAMPYLEAAECISTCKDNYGCDTGTSVVLYLLSNLSAFKGEMARALKAELKEHVK